MSTRYLFYFYTFIVFYFLLLIFFALLFFPVTWMKVIGDCFFFSLNRVKLIYIAKKGNLMTCLLRFINIMFGNYWDIHFTSKLLRNLLKLAIFQLFDNVTWYWSMSILFERQHDIWRCANVFVLVNEGVQPIFFHVGRKFCHFFMLRYDLPKYITKH